MSLGPLEEALALTTNPNSKNIILGAFDLTGPLNTEAVKKTVGSLGDGFPHLRTCLQEIKIRGRHHLVWDYRTKLEIPLSIWNLSDADPSRSSLDVLLSCLEPSLTRDRNLLEEPAIEFHLIKLDQDHHLLACIMGHVAADAITLAEIVKEFMAKYHKLVIGERPAFSCHAVSVSTSRKRAVRKKKTILIDYWRTLRQAMVPYAGCSLPVGTGIPGDLGEHYIKRLFSAEETEDIVSKAIKIRVPFVDYLMASVSLAVDRWNEIRKTASSTLSAALTVNMQGRFQDRDGPNNDSVLYFQFSQNQRKDPKTLARLVYRLRIKQFREQMDLKYSKGMAKLNNFLSIFPFKIRQKAYLQILQRHQTSFALGFMGVLWPASDGRRISGDSYLTSAGGLNITEAHGIAYRIVSNTPLYLTAYFFRKRLNLILSAATWQFTREEAQAFLDLVVDILARQAPGESH
jgi:hypothetical protein